MFCYFFLLFSDKISGEARESERGELCQGGAPLSSPPNGIKQDRQVESLLTG